MKKVSTVGSKQSSSISQLRLTIGLDLGDRNSWRGGRNGKKRAIVATARKLAVLPHHLWVSGEVYEPLHNSQHPTMMAAALKPKGKTKSKPFQEGKRQKPKRSSGDCVNRLAQVRFFEDRTTGRQTDSSNGECNSDFSRTGDSCSLRLRRFGRSTKTFSNLLPRLRCAERKRGN